MRNAHPDERRFFVTARRDIGDKIKRGDHVLIDPDAKPQPGRWVLVEWRLERWSGQEHKGVAIQTHRSVEAVPVARHEEVIRG